MFRTAADRHPHRPHLDPPGRHQSQRSSLRQRAAQENCDVRDVEPKGFSVLTEMKEPYDDTKEAAMNRKNYETLAEAAERTHVSVDKRPDASTLDRPRAP